MMFKTPALRIIDVPVKPTHRIIPVRPRQINFIYLHATAAPDGKSSVPWLSGTSLPAVSCHRVIDRLGNIYKLVPDDQIAFTQGHGRMGARTRDWMNLNVDGLSIELENENRIRQPFETYPLVQIRACAWQVVEWWGAYGFIPVMHHRYVDSEKHDPSGFPEVTFYTLLRDRLRDVLA